MEILSIFKPLSKVAPYAWMFSVSSIALVFIGWRVSYKNSAKLATRSETKSLIDALSKLVNEISDISINYWLNSSDEKRKKKDVCRIKTSGSAMEKKASAGSKHYLMNVMAKTTQSARYIKILKSRGIDLSDELLSSIHEKATLDCEIASTFSDNIKAVRAQEVMAACMETVETIYATFHVSHPPSSLLSLRKRVGIWFNTLEEWNKSLGNCKGP